MSRPDPLACRGGIGLPRLGLGTWEMGRDTAARADESRVIRSALELRLTAEDLTAIDAAYPVPDRDVPLECW